MNVVGSLFALICNSNLADGFLGNRARLKKMLAESRKFQVAKNERL